MNKATFHVNRFFLGSIGNFSIQESYAIIKSSEELEKHMQDLLAFLKQDTAIIPYGYWETFEKELREFYSLYDDRFFQQNNLVMAIVDQGSSLVGYEYLGSENKNGLLTINVKRIAPMIQTMDFVTWVLNLELDKTESFDSVLVNLTDEEHDFHVGEGYYFHDTMKN